MSVDFKAFFSDTFGGPYSSQTANGLKGKLYAAPDKSCSHRAMILGALAQGVTEVTGLLESADVMATAQAMESLGAQLDRQGPGDWTITGQPAWTSPEDDLDLGNAGTGVRLVMGAVSRFDLTARFVGDESLSRRPMARILDPLRKMGIEADAAEGARLPITLKGQSPLNAIEYTPPIASAQVKSAILLAGLGADGTTIIHEPTATRDHTETMLPLFGCPVKVQRDGASATIQLEGGHPLSGTPLIIPGDPSSAAFLTAAALITPGSVITLKGMMTNPARFGLYVVLKEMGADISFTPAGEACGEALCDITVRYSALNGVTVPAYHAASMIDEFPILSVIAAFASGPTRMEGLAELRAKESDRLAASAAMLEANGVTIRLEEDALTVFGRGEDLIAGGGLVETHHDHRLAMSGLVLGLRSQAPVIVDDVAMIATSYPDFFDDMKSVGAQIDSTRTY